MRASAEPLEDNRVRLSVEVEAAEVDASVDQVVRALSRQARIPGFRPGKVPRKVLEARMGGKGALRAEALREAIPDFYARALVDADVDPIAQPEIDVKTGEEAGDLEFEALVEVRPAVNVPGYSGLVVTVPSPEVSDEDVQREIDRLRETDAELEPVSRPAVDGDNVTLDLYGTDSDGEEVTSAEDLVYEVGTGTLLPELDQQVRGATAGTILAFDSEAPDGSTVKFKAMVKDVQRKVLPELTDEWVEESTESGTVDELRASLRTRLEQVKVLQARLAVREGAVRALAELVEDDAVPETLVDEELRERLSELEQRLQSRGVGIEELLAATSRSQEDLIGELRGEAVHAVKVDLALRAVATAEELEVSEEEFEQELAQMAERLGTTSAELRHRLDHNGRTGAVRSEQLKGKALTWLVEHVELVDEEGRPVAREALEQPASGDQEDHGTVTEVGQAEEGAEEGSAPARTEEDS